MKRLTTDNPVSEMGMAELAHNSCFAKDRQAFYRDYDKEIDAREMAKNLVKTYGADYEYTGDTEQFEKELFDGLQYGLNDITGLIAFIYRQLWAQADLYEVLKRYEKTNLTPEQITALIESNKALTKENARLEKENEWIPVEERLPENGKDVITYDCENGYEIETYYNCNPSDRSIIYRQPGFYIYSYECGLVHDDSIIAWKPLPQPYKESEKQ